MSTYSLLVLTGLC